MQTIAWLLIVSGALLVRQVAKGRAMQSAEDLSDMFVAIVTLDNKGVKKVLAREAPAQGNSSVAPPPVTPGAPPGAGSAAPPGAKAPSVPAPKVAPPKSVLPPINPGDPYGGYDPPSGGLWG